MYDAQSKRKSLRKIAREQKLPESTARDWLKQRKTIGSPAYRHTRKLSTRLGRPSRISKRNIKQALRAPLDVRTEPLEAQIAYHDFDISVSQFKRKLLEYSKKARMYKAAYYKKTLSAATRRARVEYGERHQDKTVESFWQWVIFTDEFHYNPSAQGDPWELREEGTRYKPENVVGRPPKESGIILHGAGWVNWHAKCEKLIFWRDSKTEETKNKLIKAAENAVDETIKEKRPPRPQYPRRRPTTESKIEWEERLTKYTKDLEAWESAS